MEGQSGMTADLQPQRQDGHPWSTERFEVLMPNRKAQAHEKPDFGRVFCVGVIEMPRKIFTEAFDPQESWSHCLVG